MTKKTEKKGLENHNPIQEIIAIIKHQLGRCLYKVTYKLGFSPYCIFGLTGYSNQWGLGAIKYRLSKIKFIPENFLGFHWHKRIAVGTITGFEIKDEHIFKYKKSEYNFVYENRRYNLYSPFVIHSFYNAIADDRKVVVKNDDIETHEFRWCVQRKRYLWNNYYQITVHQDDDETEFDRALDSYLSGDQ
tara:strand:- start:93 stop:659 length:567 start_codon:yes stop_codon:yes gene_type:complete